MLNTTKSDGWNAFLQDEFHSDYYKKLVDFVASERKLYKIFPKDSLVFNAFNLTPFAELKVVIVGQDPYHSYEKNTSHAHGLSFSVPKSAQKMPPSLKNIMKELHQDLGIEIPKHGDLTAWAKQGVLLLNATLTVRAHEAGSHQKKGWEIFTDNVIKKLSAKKEGLVFLLWGKSAQQKELLVNSQKHFVLKAAHPSPFSAYKGFFDCHHFSKTNHILSQNQQKEIDWNIQ